MQFGICVMAEVDEIELFAHAENLGYDSVWVTDSQMIFSDCYAVLALAAQATERIRLGPGTAICGTRIPPVQVAAMATLNKLAPGRVHLGIGTGNTAMRTMGQRPMRIADYDEYLGVLAGLLRGVAVTEALGHARAGAARAGRRLDGFRNCALTNVALLEPGEAVDSPRVVRTVGPNVMASVYYFYDEVQERGIDPPEFLRPIWKRYCALVEQTPAEHRHFRTHEFHYTYLHPGEAELIDANLIRATCLVGTADEVVEQVRELGRQGLQELMFATGVDDKWRTAEAFSRNVMARI